MVSHDSEGEGARESDSRGKGGRKEIDHDNGKGTGDERDDAEILFGFGKRVELVGEDEEEGGMKKCGVFSVELDLSLKVASGVVESMDFINP